MAPLKHRRYALGMPLARGNRPGSGSEKPATGVDGSVRLARRGLARRYAAGKSASVTAQPAEPTTFPEQNRDREGTLE